MNPLLGTVLYGLAAPALGLLAAAFWLGRQGWAQRPLPLAVLAAAALFLGGAALAGWPPLPPVATAQWIGYGALAAGAAACLTPFLPPAGAWTARTALVALLLWTAARPKFGGAWTAGQGVLSLLAATALVTGLWFLLDHRARAAGAGPLRFSLPLGAAMGAGAALFFQEGSLLLAQWAGLAALLTGAAGLGLALGGRDRSALGALGVLVPVYGLIAANALWYTDLPVPLALALWAALALPALVGLRAARVP